MAVVLALFALGSAPVSPVSTEGCPSLQPPLAEWGPLCIADGVEAVQYDDIVALTWWDPKLVEGPSPHTFFVHVYIREGKWRIVELGAMNHFGWYEEPVTEITVMYHDTVEWHALGNEVNVPPLKWVFNQYENVIVWPGCEVGAIFRIEESRNPRNLRFNLTLQRVD